MDKQCILFRSRAVERLPNEVCKVLLVNGLRRPALHAGDQAASASGAEG